MITEQELEKLREEINPVFATAQSCLRMTAKSGDADAVKLLSILGFGTDLTGDNPIEMTPDLTELVKKILPGFNASVEARFKAFNAYLEASDIQQIVDIPCGYTPRGVKFSRGSKRYFGCDLPAVIDKFAPAVRECIGENDKVTYHAVDITNYHSLRAALDGADGELLITTEGLFPYLTQAEVEETFRNIRRLLLEFGGRWITADSTLAAIQGAVLYGTVGGGSQSGASLASIGTFVASMMSKAGHAENILFDKDMGKAKQFLDEMGFVLEEIPFYDYLPETLQSIEMLPEANQFTVRNAFRGANIWVMTAKPETAEQFTGGDKDFRADVRLSGGRLDITLTGRLDTITAPTLLGLYRQAAEKGAITSISVDMQDLEYISSAGLRVMLIMHNDLEDETAFKLHHMNPLVTEIMETTGFDSVFCE